MKKPAAPVLFLTLAALALYLVLTPMGALRLAVFRAGYPVSALTLQPMSQPNRMILEEQEIGFSLENPPFEKDTQSQLINWVVVRQGPFYTGHYYGWG